MNLTLNDFLRLRTALALTLTLDCIYIDNMMFIFIKNAYGLLEVYKTIDSRAILDLTWGRFRPPDPPAIVGRH